MVHVGKTKDGGAITIRRRWKGSHEVFLRGLYMGIVSDSRLESVVLRLIHDERTRIYD